MTSKQEQFYKQQIADLQAENAALKEQVAELLKVNAELAEKVAKLSKNSSNSSKPPSSDIVKPPKSKQSDGPRRQGGQLGHKGVGRQLFQQDQFDKTVPFYADSCHCGYVGNGEPIGKPKIQQIVELVGKPVSVTEYRLYGFICPKCGRVVWAKLPATVVEGQLFGLRLQALVGYMKGSLHASCSALEDFCHDVLNIDVARSHLCNTIRRVNEADKCFGQSLLIQFKRLFHIWHLRDKIPKDRFSRIMFKIKDRILALAKQQDLPPESAILAKRFRKHGNAMFRFLFDPAVPSTNNAAEQTLRQAIIDRRITQGSRSVMGRQWNARIWTVLATCRKQGRSSWQFLQNALSAYYFQTPIPSPLARAN
ncbi:MAG TPA: DUF6444 domain-containing protein [Sedimentisphaerales bacterium]|nr:DUF6444 domain-containing protein [Sedimentisphaerales bacterium]